MGVAPGSDAALARRAAKGDQAAFESIVARHRDRVYTIALRLVANEADAEDVLQETFVAAWRALGGFGGRSQLSTWLYRIAVNKSHDVIARRRPAAALDDVAEPAARQDEVEASARRTAIVAALAALPLEFRTAAVLCDVLGLTPGEAAEVLDVPPGTVKSRSFRARALLARQLAGNQEPTTGSNEGR